MKSKVQSPRSKVLLIFIIILITSKIKSAEPSTLNPQPSTLFQALAQLETGDCDSCRGPAGEVSRYQILPTVWRRYFYSPSPSGRGLGRGRTLIDAKNPLTAYHVATAIMADRCAAFTRRYHRPPTAGEWALLWHCPARLNRQTKADRAYVHRFLNLLKP